MRIHMSDLVEASESYEGYCRVCDSITTSQVEPDADDVMCEECGNRTVMGLENAVVAGDIRIE
jgi:hypothetical protein